MQIPWWKRLDITQAAVALMTLKALMPFSALIQLPDIVDTLLLCISLFLLLASFGGRIIASVKLLFIALILCVIAAYTCIVIDDFSILITAISLAVLCFYDTRSFIQIIFWISLVFCAIHITVSLAGSLLISSAPFLIQSGDRIRFNFGMVHPNAFSSLFSSTLLMFLWLYGKRNYGIKLLIAFALQIVIFLFTNSRTALLVNMITLLLLAWNHWRAPKKLLKIALCTVIPLLTLFMFAVMCLYIKGNPFALKVNSMLNNRVVLGAYAYDHLGLSILGQHVPFHEQIKWDPKWQLGSFTFDNVYSYLLVQGGIFWIAVLAWLFGLASRRLNTTDMVFLLSWALYGMCENTVLNGYTMFSIFLLANICRHKAAPSVKRNNPDNAPLRC